jgi:hypothetical protein
MLCLEYSKLKLPKAGSYNNGNPLLNQYIFISEIKDTINRDNRGSGL